MNEKPMNGKYIYPIMAKKGGVFILNSLGINTHQEINKTEINVQAAAGFAPNPFNILQHV
jgi:hypothetical protein